MMFVEWRDASGLGQKRHSKLEATTEQEALTEAIAKANSLFPKRAAQRVIRLLSGDRNGHPVKTISLPDFTMREG
jgi:hypothetical protein